MIFNEIERKVDILKYVRRLSDNKDMLLTPIQRRYLHENWGKRKNLVLGKRQQGVTSLILTEILYDLLYEENLNICLITHSESSKNLLKLLIKRGLVEYDDESFFGFIKEEPLENNRKIMNNNNSIKFYYKSEIQSIGFQKFDSLYIDLLQVFQDSDYTVLSYLIRNSPKSLLGITDEYGSLGEINTNSRLVRNLVNYPTTVNVIDGR